MATPSIAFSAEVRAHLARTRKSPAELALALGVSEATIKRRLNDEYPWPLDDAIKAAFWSGLPVSTLFNSSEHDAAVPA